MASNLPPEGEQQINSTIIKMAEEYAASEVRSSNENEIRANIRENAEKLGIPSSAWQSAVRKTKTMTKGERQDHEAGERRVLSVLDDIAPTLWPEDFKRNEKRAENKKPKGNEGAPNPDTNERSNPDKGGAKPRVPVTKENPADAIEAKKNAAGLKVVGSEPGEMKQPDTVMPPNPPSEQEEGDKVLNDNLPETKRSQSQIAAEIAAAAGTDKPIL